MANITNLATPIDTEGKIFTIKTYTEDTSTVNASGIIAEDSKGNSIVVSNN